jgi:hypothetical protein
MTGQRVVSRTKQGHEAFVNVLFEESVRRSTTGVVSSDAFVRSYNQAVAYRAMVDRAQADSAREK